ncbi:hypothetical protein Tco_0066672 [Tanacetum coccineum]
MLTLLAMFFSGVLYYGTYGVCIGILACRGLSLVSSPLHAMKSQTQIQSSAAVKFGGVTEDTKSRDYYSEDQYDISIKKIRRIRACTHQRPQKIKEQYAVSRGLNTSYSRYGINIVFSKISNVVPTPRNPKYADSLAAAENEIAMLQIRVADAEDRRTEDHDQIQKILARLGL